MLYAAYTGYLRIPDYEFKVDAQVAVQIKAGSRRDCGGESISGGSYHRGLSKYQY